MREDITSIPVSEVFEPRDGCPLCRMRDLLEERVLEYITGAAMMEPDVRIETNRQGFCFPHYQMMLKKRNRLGVALMLESRLEEIEKQVYDAAASPFGFQAKKQVEAADKPLHTCFVCGQVDWAMERMLETVFRLWEREEAFRRLFSEQPCLCLPHFSQLSNAAVRHMGKKASPPSSGRPSASVTIPEGAAGGRDPFLSDVRLPQQQQRRRLGQFPEFHRAGRLVAHLP